MLVVGAAATRTADTHPPAAVPHRPILMTVVHRRPVAIVLAPRPDGLIDLEPYHLVQHAKPDTNRQRQQPSFAAPASSPNACCTPSGTSLTNDSSVAPH